MPGYIAIFNVNMPDGSTQRRDVRYTASPEDMLTKAHEEQNRLFEQEPTARNVKLHRLFEVREVVNLD